MARSAVVAGNRRVQHVNRVRWAQRVGKPERLRRSMRLTCALCGQAAALEPLRAVPWIGLVCVQLDRCHARRGFYCPQGLQTCVDLGHCVMGNCP